MIFFPYNLSTSPVGSKRTCYRSAYKCINLFKLQCFLNGQHFSLSLILGVSACDLV